MPVRLDIKKKLSATSERVKSVDIHPNETWALSALYSGNVMIWDYESGTCVKSFEVSELPVRCAKFIARKHWFFSASDDMRLRVYNYNTMEKVREIEQAHSDYIRCVEVHPTLPYFVSSSDDMTVKLWNYDSPSGLECIQYYEGHTHYVMQAKFNPKDTNTFASASLDRTIKVWGLNSPTPHYTLEGHERGVNCIDYYPSGDKPYILSGADDRTVKVWDYQTKSVVHTLDGHTHNVCAVLFHPKLPMIASASEDGTVRIWQSTTYRAETTLNYGMERAWALAATASANKLAIGYDEGTVVIELGSDEPVASMDGSGKIVWAKNNEIQTTNVRGLAADVGEGERLPLIPRDLGTCELYPQSLKHNCNGRFVSVCGDGEFIIYTAQALRNKAFGSALDFVWSGSETGDYAIRESISRIKVFRNFKESKTIKPATASAEGLFGGQLIGVKGSDDAVLFYDWESGVFVKKIDVCPTEVYWSEAGNLVLLACKDGAYVLSYDAAATAQAIHQGAYSQEEGIENAFDLLYEIPDTITSGKWVGDCFLYCTQKGRLNYSVGGKIQTLVHLDTSSSGATQHTILGYYRENVYLMDKSLNVVCYAVMLAVLQYQTAVMRGDFDAANELLPEIPESEYTTVARFLESQGFKEEALTVTTDVDHKFDLAIELNHVDVAHALMAEIPEEDLETTDTMAKWKKISDTALKSNDFDLCEAAALASDDFSGLLLMYSATGNLEGMEALAHKAEAGGMTNVAFVSYLLTGQVEKCADLLISTKRLPEAAFFARTFLPSRVQDIVTLWKEDLTKISTSAAQALATPLENKDHFPDFDIALQVEKMFLAQRDISSGAGIPAADYLTAKDDLDLNLIELIKARAAAVESVPEVQEEKAVDAPEQAQEVVNEAPVAVADVCESAVEEEDNSAQIAALAAQEEARRLQAEAEAQAKAQAEAQAQREAEEAALLAKQKEEEEAAAAAAALAKQKEEEELKAAEEAAAALAEADDDDFGDDW
mmetsp:Transcript_29239/g.45436  ORF Transcript_29239/g.45436 Transcript_29239/m.45436 type:complete len:999 (+) Transcript_29239:52-3048(+)|eukprot:CAMPEP_0196820640 /NCGR_PEP_ID=MMETSP1362-20130617/76180_1 /TAXON_ID=163516 /ORGANISM="Leptocylindrus danicus, Strain CCMP1856" /LENGTH=998 /DNA_ID=CAMNT_0042199603 /DNA_START=30 /DNA_END=3026 /DNA_ORIENTATION=+